MCCIGLRAQTHCDASFRDAHADPDEMAVGVSRQWGGLLDLKPVDNYNTVVVLFSDRIEGVLST